jgi:hypothetical protein
MSLSLQNPIHRGSVVEPPYVITLTLEPRDVAATAASGRPDVVYIVLAIQRVWLRAGSYKCSYCAILARTSFYFLIGQYESRS